jgi:hypothetical protein
MLYDQFRQVVTRDQIQIFKDFLNKQDRHVDDRGDVYNKLMTPDLPDWPIDELTRILDQVLPDSYQIENADFVRMSFHSRLHTDTDNGDQRRLYKNVIIPLEENNDAATAIFPNRWYGPAAKFSRASIPQFQYQIKDIEGQEVLVDDIRALLSEVQKSANAVHYQGHVFDIDARWLADLIQKRKVTDARVNDYTGVTDLVDTDFPEAFRQQHLNHIPAENLHGLRLPEIAQWTVGDVITFDRQHLHSGTSHLKSFKSFLAVFTYHA